MMSTTTNDIAPEDGRGWLRRAARVGYFARGLVYVIIGYFAFRAAFASGSALDTKDAIEVIAGAGFGSVLLVVTIVGLFAFAAWRVIQAIWDVDDHGSGFKGYGVRAGMIVSAIATTALALYAVTLLIGFGGGGGEGGGAKAGVIAYAYEQGYGIWLTYLIAAGIAAAAIAYFIKGVMAKFEDHMSIPQDKRWILKPVCQFGLIARSAVFVVIAGLLVKGAAGYTQDDTPGIHTALVEISSWSYGWLLLSLTGLGLIAFGISSFTEGTYRRIVLPDEA
ncbi:DUF1206 domain-containing protein [Jiella pelagia]|uniref:DUF1206 domain-containing protein n=1 Tax=Jiella pelagia TaxID=2986949 RepID=A0ABY7C0I7_9HYPH|nr:DUF1206 domain-containing protein [Jiella pelagia]WAP69599.1 DUF1206 domain-containing protein [Jiella pelagia]